MKGLSKGRYDETFAGEDGLWRTKVLYATLLVLLRAKDKILRRKS